LHSRPSEYGFYWHLYQDGTIGFEAKLTGIVSTHALFPEEVAAGGQPQWGTRLAPGVNAHVHQHFFMVRLDPTIDCPDGGKNLQVRDGARRRLLCGIGWGQLHLLLVRKRSQCTCRLVLRGWCAPVPCCVPVPLCLCLLPARCLACLHAKPR
jgi:hypothetical protein